MCLSPDTVMCCNRMWNMLCMILRTYHIILTLIFFQTFYERYVNRSFIYGYFLTNLCFLPNIFLWFAVVNMLNILFNSSGHFNAPGLPSALPVGLLFVQPPASIKTGNVLGTGTLQGTVVYCISCKNKDETDHTIKLSVKVPSKLTWVLAMTSRGSLILLI